MAERSTSKSAAAAQAKTSLAAMLIMARDLDRLTVESLGRSYQVPLPDIEQMLAAERQRRATHPEKGGQHA